MVQVKGDVRTHLVKTTLIFDDPRNLLSKTNIYKYFKIQIILDVLSDYLHSAANLYR